MFKLYNTYYIPQLYFNLRYDSHVIFVRSFLTMSVIRYCLRFSIQILTENLLSPLSSKYLESLPLVNFRYDSQVIFLVAYQQQCL